MKFMVTNTLYGDTVYKYLWCDRDTEGNIVIKGRALDIDYTIRSFLPEDIEILEE